MGIVKKETGRAHSPGKPSLKHVMTVRGNAKKLPIVASPREVAARIGKTLKIRCQIDHTKIY